MRKSGSLNTLFWNIKIKTEKLKVVALGNMVKEMWKSIVVFAYWPLSIIWLLKYVNIILSYVDFLVVQWLRVLLPMQGTQVQALVREDPTCHRATKPVCHNYWACVLEPTSHNYWAHVPQLLKSTCLEPVLCNKRSHRNEKPAHHNQEQSPLTATRESPRAATKTQHSQK